MRTRHSSGTWRPRARGVALTGCAAVLVALWSLLPSACGDIFSSLVRPPDTVLVGGGEQQNVAVLSVKGGVVFARLGPVPLEKDAYALSTVTHRLYLTARGNAAVATLLVIDTRSLAIVEREPLSTISARIAVGDIFLDGSYALAVSADGARLIMDAYHGGTGGLELIDASSLTPVDFLGPLYVTPGGLIRAPTSGGEDRYWAVGARTAYWSTPRADYLYLLGDRPFAVLDSFQLTPPGAGGSIGLYQVLPSSNGSTVYVLTADSILKFDLSTRRVQASAPCPSQGSLVLSPDESRLYLTDPGYFPDWPGSGLVFVYNSSLDALRPIDLRTSPNVVPVSNYAAFTEDSRYLLVSSGTASGGPLFGSQPGAVYVIDASTNAVVRVIRTGDWLARQLFVF